MCAVEQADEPSQAYIDQVHAQFTAAVQQLYNAHRHVLTGWESRNLEIR